MPEMNHGLEDMELTLPHQKGSNWEALTMLAKSMFSRNSEQRALGRTRQPLPNAPSHGDEYRYRGGCGSHEAHEGGQRETGDGGIGLLSLKRVGVPR